MSRYVECPFCDLKFVDEEAAVRHAIKEATSHTIEGYHLGKGVTNQDRFWCWCSGPYYSLSELVGHLGNHGGYRLHALDLLLGLERIIE